MNILFDATVLEIPFTGVAKSVLYLYENCQKIDPNINFYGFIKDKPFSKLPSYITLCHLQKNFFEKKYSKSTINREVKRTKPDIIHFPWSGNIPFKFKNLKTVMTLHDVLPLEIPNFFGSRGQKYSYI